MRRGVFWPSHQQGLLRMSRTYVLGDISAGAISFSRRVIWLMENSWISITKWIVSSKWLVTLNLNNMIYHDSRGVICFECWHSDNYTMFQMVKLRTVTRFSVANGFVTVVEYWHGWFEIVVPMVLVKDLLGVQWVTVVNSLRLVSKVISFHDPHWLLFSQRGVCWISPAVIRLSRNRSQSKRNKSGEIKVEIADWVNSLSELTTQCFCWWSSGCWSLMMDVHWLTQRSRIDAPLFQWNFRSLCSLVCWRGI